MTRVRKSVLSTMQDSVTVARFVIIAARLM